MITSTIVVQGTVTPDGGLTIDQKIALPAGPVQITIQQATESKSTQKGWWQQLQEARAILEGRASASAPRQKIGLWARSVLN